MTSMTGRSCFCVVSFTALLTRKRGICSMLQGIDMLRQWLRFAWRCDSLAGGLLAATCGFQLVVRLCVLKD